MEASSSTAARIASRDHELLLEEQAAALAAIQRCSNGVTVDGAESESATH